MLSIFAAVFMEAVEKDIINGALSMFNKYGIRSVTMDDVARELGISKKTIYKYFENKADLVHKGMVTVYEDVCEELHQVQERNDNAIDELIEINEVVSKIMENHNPSLRFQLQKYYSQTYAKVYEGTNKLMQKVISTNIQKGKENGYYRQDAETKIIAYLYCSKIERIPEDDNSLIEEYSMPVIAKQALEYHIRGLATEKGLHYMNEKFKEL